MIDAFCRHDDKHKRLPDIKAGRVDALYTAGILNEIVLAALAVFGPHLAQISARFRRRTGKRAHPLYDMDGIVEFICSAGAVNSEDLSPLLFAFRKKSRISRQ